MYESEEAQQTTIELWKKLAARYKNEKIVIGYDLLNEPIPHFYENKEDLNKLLEPFYKKRRRQFEVLIRIISSFSVDRSGIQIKIFGAPFDKNRIHIS